MSMSTMNANSELAMAGEVQGALYGPAALSSNDGPTWEIAPRSILKSTLDDLSSGRVLEAVAHFDEGFKFNDHALALEFTNEQRLTEFFQKARELFPDTRMEVISLMESGDYAIAQWKLTATQTVPSYGSLTYRLRVSLHGSTIARIRNGRIVQWSNYYDQSSSWRAGLASCFMEWIEY